MIESVKMECFQRLCFLFCFSIVSVVSVSSKTYHVPVLIWRSNEVPSKGNTFSSLARVDSDTFLNYFLKLVHTPQEKPSVLLFIEETLSIEDFNLQDENNEKAFKSLKPLAKAGKLDFISSVENPATVLTNEELKSYGYRVENWSEDIKDIKSGHIYTVKLEDAKGAEDRVQMLQRHDEKIMKIIDGVSKDKNLIAVLTGRYSSWTEPEEVLRIRRQANITSFENITASSGYALDGETFLLYTSKNPVLKLENSEILLKTLSYPTTDKRERYQRVVFSASTELGNLKLRFRFNNNTQSWYFPEIEVLDSKHPEGIKLVPNQPIEAAFNNSFVTGQPVTFKNGSNSITFVNLQIQPYLSGEKKFGAAEDSVPFFTGPIWSGILVTALLAMIMIWALSMILGIRTMDQFDDPKGKTITVNVTD